MLIKKAPDVRYSEITPESLYRGRREFLRAAAAAAVGTAAALPTMLDAQGAPATGNLPAIPNVKKSPLSTTEKPTAYSDFSTYNNFYEFGTDKSEPVVYAKRLKTRDRKSTRLNSSH